MMLGRLITPIVAIVTVALVSAGAVVLVASNAVLASTTPTTSDCATESAVPDPTNNPGLVYDCEALLASRDTLAAPDALQGIAPTATITPIETTTPTLTPVPPATPGGDTTKAQPGGLFSEVDGDPPPSIGVDTLDSRLVDIDFGQLDTVIETPVGPKDPITGEPPIPQTLVLNLFDYVVFTGIVEHVEPTASGHALWGGLDGVELGTMTMVVNGSVVVGTVRTPSAVYTIRTAGGVYVRPADRRVVSAAVGRAANWGLISWTRHPTASSPTSARYQRSGRHVNANLDSHPSADVILETGSC